MDYKPLHAAANTVPLLLVAILGLSLSAASQYDHTYYVTPNVSLCTNVNYTCQDFRTYFNNVSYYFQSGTEFIFLPGVHLFDLGGIHSVQDIVNIRLVGSDTFTQRSVAEDVEEYGFDPYAYDNNISYLQSSTLILCTNPSALSFSNVLNLTLANFTILNCGHYWITNISDILNVGVYLFNVYNLLIDGLTIKNSSGCGLCGLNVLGQSQIMRSSFVGNNQFVKNMLAYVPIRNCMNDTGRLYISEHFEYKGGNVHLEYSNVSHSSLRFQLDISLVVSALGINGGQHGAGLTFRAYESMYNLNITIDGLIVYRNHVGYGNGVNFLFDISSSISNIILINIFSAYATLHGSGAWYSSTAVSTVPSWFIVTNATFECSFSEGGSGSSMSISQSGYGFATLHNCTFKHDQSTSSLDISNRKTNCITDSSCELRIHTSK